MKKLKLDVDKLEVESFDTKAGEKRRGTVVGHFTMVITRPQYECSVASG